MSDAGFDLILDIASTLQLSRCRRILGQNGLHVRLGHDHYGAAGGPILGTLPRFFGLVARSP